MNEVDFGGGAPHMAKRSMINLCVLGCPLPPYIKEQGGGRPDLGARQGRRNPPPSRSRIPPFLLLLGGGRKGERGEGKGGAAPPPSPIRTRGRGGTRPTLAAPLSSHQGPCGPLTLPRGSGNPPGTPVFSEITRNLSGVRI